MLKTNQKIHQITYSDGQNPSPLDQLTEFSITGQSQKLRDQMLADIFGGPNNAQGQKLFIKRGHLKRLRFKYLEIIVVSVKNRTPIENRLASDF